MRSFSWLVPGFIVFNIGCGSGDRLSESLSSKSFEKMMPGEHLPPMKAKVLKMADQNLFRSIVDQHFAEMLQDSRFDVAPSTSLVHGPNSGTFELRYEGIPVCDSEIRHSKSHILMSTHENGLALGHDASDIDSAEAGLMVQSALEDLGYHAGPMQIIAERQCYSGFADILIPARELIVELDQRLFRASVDRKSVFKLEAMQFDVTGSARVYSTNPETGSLKDFSLAGLTGDGTLENKYFTTSTPETKARSSEHVFNYSTSDGRFDEVSMFVHVNEQLVWFQEHGYKWQGNDKLNLYVHAVISGSVNNALYTPSVGSTPAKIQVGDGDGVRLRNLPKDSDVVAHEFGHHVVYDNIKSVRGESLVLHEGLADYFAFARTSDPCLGESICPADSPIGCEVEQKCLRTADNDYVLNKNTKPEAHFKSQFVSGMLWDLRGDAVPEAALDKIVLAGVKMVLSESGYHDFVLGLLLADDELYAGKYCKKIYKAAIDRGLQSHISDFGCDEDLPQLSALDNAGGSVESTTTTSKSSDSDSGSLFGCGVIRGQHSSALGLLIFGLLMPLVLRRRSR